MIMTPHVTNLCLVLLSIVGSSQDCCGVLLAYEAEIRHWLHDSYVWQQSSPQRTEGGVCNSLPRMLPCTQARHPMRNVTMILLS